MDNSDDNLDDNSANLKRTYYLNGQLKSEYFMVNGLREGPYKEYHLNGTLFMECEYINNLVCGNYKLYYSKNNKIYICCHYVNGIKDGKETYYHDDDKGDKFFEYVWSNGILIDKYMISDGVPVHYTNNNNYDFDFDGLQLSDEAEDEPEE